MLANSEHEHGNSVVRDAIVTSGWVWPELNVPERLALTLAHAGARVLYCENPLSFFREPIRPLVEAENRVFVYRLAHFSHRLNPLLSRLQAKIIASQIESKARRLKLNDPIFFYPHGESYRTLAREMKERGFDLVHVCMDYHIQEQIEHVQLSDMTLVIIEAAYLELRDRFGNKIRRLREFGPMAPSISVGPARTSQAAPLLATPNPRLVYLGSVHGRIDLKLVAELLQKHKEWHFVAFGSEDRLGLPNSHFLPWLPANEWSKVFADGAIGFMPYDCSIPKNLHCAPLKLFDYFARGIPVVSTPIVYVRDYRDLVYTGGTVDELARAVQEAIEEPADSPKRMRRMALVAKHSIDTMSRILSPLLDEKAGFPPSNWEEDESAKPQNLSR